MKYGLFWAGRQGRRARGRDPGQANEGCGWSDCRVFPLFEPDHFLDIGSRVHVNLLDKCTPAGLYVYQVHQGQAL
jgi:hypothetical protein